MHQDAESKLLLSINHLLLAATLLFGLSSLQAQTPSPLADDSIRAFRVRFGFTDTEPRVWDGELSVDRGEVINLRNWNPRPGESIKGESGWTLATQQGLNYPRRVYQWEDPRGTEEYLDIPGIVVDVRTTSSTRVGFTTANGDFEVWPNELQAGQPMTLLDGAVIVDLVAPAERLSSDQVNSDFPTVLAGVNGELWTAWVTYRDGSNRVLARRFDGRRMAVTRDDQRQSG